MKTEVMASIIFIIILFFLAFLVEWVFQVELSNNLEEDFIEYPVQNAFTPYPGG